MTAPHTISSFVSMAVRREENCEIAPKYPSAHMNNEMPMKSARRRGSGILIVIAPPCTP
jgi:hypothetical protein